FWETQKGLPCVRASVGLPYLSRHEDTAHRPSRYGEFGFEIAGFWNEQYCSAKHPDTGQYPISQGDLLR
ncbi:MAG TPA: hypothetical protein VJ255_12395, partial [Candidatus Acidoferrum sp.]|nr:hypothetical protein [Candidatus Acidoferrum sp.]